MHNHFIDSSVLTAFVRGRRTVHEFEPAAPPRKILLEALEAACWAPNHRRTEPWRFHLPGPRTAEQLIALNTELERAKSGEAAALAKQARWRAMPGWLVVTCRHHQDPLVEREDYAACCCAIQNLMLVLWAHGLGSKWSTGKVTRDARFLSALGVAPRTEFVVGLLWYGYPRSVPAQTRSALGAVLNELD